MNLSEFNKEKMICTESMPKSDNNPAHGYKFKYFGKSDKIHNIYIPNDIICVYIVKGDKIDKNTSLISSSILHNKKIVRSDFLPIVLCDNLSQYDSECFVMEQKAIEQKYSSKKISIIVQSYSIVIPEIIIECEYILSAEIHNFSPPSGRLSRENSGSKHVLSPASVPLENLFKEQNDGTPNDKSQSLLNFLKTNNQKNGTLFK